MEPQIIPLIFPWLMMGISSLFLSSDDSIRLLLEHDANVVALNNDCSIPLDICKSDEIRELFKQVIAAKGSL